MSQNFNLGAYGDPGGAIGLGNFRNKIINGAMDVWQRGPSFAVNNTAMHTADRWYAGSGIGGVAAVSRQPHFFSEAYPTTYYLQFAQTTGASNQPWLTQRIENVRTLAGKSITVSFAAAVYASPISIGVIYRQNFGTGGSPSATVDTVIGSINLSSTGTIYAPSVTGTVPSVAGKTLGTNGDDYAEIIFLFPASTVFTLNIWNIQVEEGVFQTPFEIRPKGVELALCQRYYEVGQDGFSAYQSAGVAIGYYHGFKVPKRAAPTMAITVAPAGTSNCTGVSAGVIGTDSFYAYGVATATGTSFFTASWKADAEL